MKATRGGRSLQLEEPGAGGDELLAGDAEFHGPGAAGDDDVGGVERPAVHLDLVRAEQPRRAVQGLGAGVAHPALDPLGHRLGERALARDQGGPVDRGRARESAPAQPARATDRLRRREQDLLGVAAALGAGAAVGQAVDDRHPQARLRAPRRHVLGGRAAADHGDVVLGHRALLRSSGGGMPVSAGAPPPAPFEGSGDQSFNITHPCVKPTHDRSAPESRQPLDTRSSGRRMRSSLNGRDC